MNKTILLFTGLILSAGVASSQMTRSHFSSISLNFLQIKEEANHGLVFRGPGLGYAYSSQWQNEKYLIGYEGRIFLEVPFTRGIVAASINFVPVRLDYLFKIGNENNLCLGPFFTMDYHLESYPDLQSGYSYWFTHYSLGGALNYSFNLRENHFDLAFHTTVLGITSRQPVYDDPYFYDLGLDIILQNVHHDFQPGSFNRYNQSELELRWYPKGFSRLAFAYTFQYYGYFEEPELTILNQSIKLIILPNKEK